MANLLEDMSSYLINKGYAVGLGTDIFTDVKPDAPDNVVVLTEYPGLPLQHGISSADRNVQVLVRNLDYYVCRALIMNIHKTLDDTENRIIYFTAERWAIGYARQTPFRLSQDSNRRTEFVFNYGVTTYRD